MSAAQTIRIAIRRGWNMGASFNRLGEARGQGLIGLLITVGANGLSTVICISPGRTQSVSDPQHP
jgi:hypothetical protein